MNLEGIGRRLDRLEGSGPDQGPDYEMMALEALSDEELGVLQEGRALHGCGHTDAQIEGMMGVERWKLLQEAVGRYQAEYARLIADVAGRQSSCLP